MKNLFGKIEKDIYKLTRDDNEFVVYTINFNEKYIHVINYYQDKPEEIEEWFYYWETKIGTYYDETNDCFFKMNMNNKAFISDECNCTYLYADKEAYKNSKANIVRWNEIYTATITPFLNTPIDPNKLN